MTKASAIASSLTILLALAAGAPLAQAQVYTTSYPVTTSGYGYQNSSCIELTAPMTIGASDYLNGGQVSELQEFLVRDGLLPSQYVTGYYGSLTAGAVAQFQASRGISPVGVVGPITRSAIQQVSCGGTSIVSPANPISPINPGGPIIFNQPLELSSLSSNGIGSNIIITLQGSGFDANDNTVHFGTAQISDISSTDNGQELSFNVPSVVAGTYQVYVSTSRGQTNTLSYYYSGSTTSTNCNYYYNGVQYNSCTCVSQVGYNNSNTCNNGSVIINSASGSSGYSGSSVTIYGSGFTSSGNSVNFGGTVISNIYSNNGSSLTFDVPSINYNGGSETLPVYVINGNGVSSNTIQFSINSSGYTSNGPISISYLSPSEGSVNSVITIQGSGFSSIDNTVHFGVGGQTNVNSYNNGQTITFTVPSSLSPCALNGNSVCPLYQQLVTAGSYPVYVTNQYGQSSNTVNFEVY